MATTVEVIRLVTGYFAEFPDIVAGCDMDESIASAVNTFVGHGWAATIEDWDLTAEEADTLIEAGKYRCGVIANPYTKPIEAVSRTRHMTQSTDYSRKVCSNDLLLEEMLLGDYEAEG